ncbi:7839_t:CDS:10, partial [Dentiscutata erythropus]
RLDGKTIVRRVTAYTDSSSMKDSSLMKCLAWSPDPSYQSLIAISSQASQTDKIVLVNLHEGEAGEAPSNDFSVSSDISSVYQPQPYITLNLRNSKCNALSFSPEEPRLLAAGLERTRKDYGLLIWDVEQPRYDILADQSKQILTQKLSTETLSRTGSISGRSDRSIHNELGYDGYPSFPLEPSKSVYETSRFAPTSSHVRNDEIKPTYQHGLDESVNSCSWFPSNRRLVAGMSMKNLRIYDLRKDNYVQCTTTKSVHGVNVDPFNENRVASFEESYIHLWDLRKFADIPTDSKPVRISFSKARSGILTSLEKDSSHLTLYDIQESTFKLRQSSTINRNSPLENFDPHTNLTDGFSAGIAVGGNSTPMSEKNIIFGAPVTVSNRTDEEFDTPVLWKSRKSRRCSKNISSFSWITTFSTPTSHRLISVNKDGVYNLVTLEETPQFCWSPEGNMVVFYPKGFRTFDIDEIHGTIEESNSKRSDSHNMKSQGHSNIGGTGHKHHVSLDLRHDHDHDSGNRTPRPGDINNSKDAHLFGRQLKGIILNQQHRSEGLLTSISGDSDHGLSPPLKLIREDISVVMRKRAKRGYSMLCTANEELVRDSPKLKSLWNWIAQAELLSEGKATIGNVDFSFQGVYSIWTASVPSSKKQSPISTPKTSSPRSTPEKVDQGLVDDNEIPIVPTSKLSQRKLALAMCGWDFGKKELENVIRELENANNYEKAAGIALFHGNTERAITALNNSKVERLELISATLAAFNDHSHSNQKNTLLRKMCNKLSNELREPYLRVIFSFIASGNWLYVLQQQEELALLDRVCIALRFLDDDELSTYLSDTANKVKADGDIEGIIITGLTSDGVTLFEKYVDNTGDVQTASLAMSFCVPRKFKDDRVADWIENYRLLLDKWEMFRSRALFDIARGKHMGTSPSAAENIPPQVYVRCNFCSQSIAHNLCIPGKNRRVTLPTSYHLTPGGILPKQKTTCCPVCYKSLPRCSICLLSLGTPTDHLREVIAKNGSTNDIKGSGFDLWFTWCQSCRHGGHALHMSQWFEKHKICPVSECPCECPREC